MKRQKARFAIPSVPDIDVVAREIRTFVRHTDADLTIADLIVSTGLPRHSIEEALSRLSCEIGFSESVTERGEILYHFDDRLTSRVGGQSVLARLFGRIGDAGGGIARGLLKRLPLLCMSGYFVFFLTFPFPPALILLAILVSSWSDMDLLDFYGSSQRRKAESVQSPLFMLREYLYGSAVGSDEGNGQELLAVLAAVRSKMGVISLADVLELTGLPPWDAQQYLDALLIRFTGEPAVTTSGRVVYCFPELLRSGVGKTSTSAGNVSEVPNSDAVPQRSPGRKHGIISFINLSNLLFSVYYGTLSLRTMISGGQSGSVTNQLHPGISVLFNAIYSLACGIHAGFILPAVFFGLGVIPFGMSTLFFARHRRAMAHTAAERREATDRRLRRAVYASVLANPDSVAPNTIRIPPEISRRGNTGNSPVTVIDELAASYHADIEDDGAGHLIYHFPELENEASELAEMRRSAERRGFDVGRVVFRSREKIE